MAQNVPMDGKQAFKDDYDRWMSDPAFRTLYEYEGRKKELWRQLVEMRLDSELTPAQMAECLGIPLAEWEEIEDGEYDSYTLDDLYRFVNKAIDSGLLLKVAETQKKKMWQQLINTRKASGLTAEQMAARLEVSPTEVESIEKTGYSRYTLDALCLFVIKALGGHSLLQAA